MDGAGVIDLEVLGPLGVRVGEERVSLGPTLRVLLLGLLCAHGDLVPAGRLAGMLSGTGVPHGSPATLRSHISHLRRALGDTPRPGGGDRAQVLVTDHVAGTAAYALRVNEDRIDAARFTRRVARGIRELNEGEAWRAGELLRQATSLWRGQPLADVADRAFAQVEIKRLEGTYRAAVIARIQADMHRGLHQTVVGELQALVPVWPEDEAVRILLVTSLYRCGRVAEAAHACQAALRAAHGHGLDSRRLAALQANVLNESLPDTGIPHLAPAPKLIGPPRA